MGLLLGTLFYFMGFFVYSYTSYNIIYVHTDIPHNNSFKLDFQEWLGYPWLFALSLLIWELTFINIDIMNWYLILLIVSSNLK